MISEGAHIAPRNAMRFFKWKDEAALRYNTSKAQNTKVNAYNCDKLYICALFKATEIAYLSQIQCTFLLLAVHA